MYILIFKFIILYNIFIIKTNLNLNKNGESIMIIAVDGPSGSGKSTISKIVASRLKIEYIDTGSMYRAVTYYFLKNNLSYDVKNLESVDIDFKNNEIVLNGEKVEQYIRTSEVTKNVSEVSSDKKIREKLVNLQRKISQGKSIILDGRDIGTVVFPNADYKFFLNARPEIRAKRRYNEIKDKQSLSYDDMLEQIKTRDYKDSTRKESPLKKAYDAIEIDSSEMTIEEVVEKILSIVKE